ncbi:hypothetical protein EVAR_34280_1 [Eumeta japonica]|uniref:Uncharacterized protein n=1 Tax=Eumeta variegata TaxID=151549 RepID=A0A4C1VZL1_EUMVA|nr:hypothetical protein EVAR_34280_1 [Eumeta japonica]
MLLLSPEYPVYTECDHDKILSGPLERKATERKNYWILEKCARSLLNETDAPKSSSAEIAYRSSWGNLRGVISFSPDSWVRVGYPMERRNGLMERECSDRGGSGVMEAHEPPEISLIRRSAIAGAVT